MDPMISWKVEECQQRLAIFDQTIDGLVIFGRVLFSECRHGRFSRSPIRRQPNFAQVLVRVGLQRLLKLVENIQRLVQPTSLVPRRRKRLVESFPESECAVASGNLRCDRQAARLQINEQLLPTLCALPLTSLKADQLLPAL